MHCPHCRRFREERDEALEALRQVQEDRDENLALRLQRAFQLSQQNAALLAKLYAARGLVSADDLSDAIGTKSRYNDVLRARVTACRRAGFRIDAFRGHGYELPACTRATLRAALEAPAGALSTSSQVVARSASGP